MKEKLKKPVFSDLSLRARYAFIFASVVILSLGILALGYAGLLKKYSEDRTKDAMIHQCQAIVRFMHTDSFDDPGSFRILFKRFSDVLYNGRDKSGNEEGVFSPVDIYVVDNFGRVVHCKDINLQGVDSDDAQLSDGKYYCREHDALEVSSEILDRADSLSAENGFGYYGECYLNTYEDAGEDLSGSKIDLIKVEITDNGDKAGSRLIAVTPLVFYRGGYGKAGIGDQKIGYVVITRDIKKDPIVDVSGITKLFIAAVLLSMLVIALVSYILAGRLTKPLRKLTDAADDFAQGNFETRVEFNRNDEVGRLADSFNSMAEALDKLEYSRRSFIANVSHELRTPMTSIGGFVDGILDGTIPPEKSEQYLRVVSDEVKRLSGVVISMLNLSKIEAGQLNLNPVPMDLTTMIVSAMLLFERQIESRRINIRGLDTLGEHVAEVDEDMFSQVLYNLIDNAVKFTPDDGYIEVFIEEDEDSVTCAIRNSGSGIPQDELARVFERFYKVDKSRSYDKKSTGLGLYIVKSIIDLHNGKISVDSVQGEYTEFSFTIPKSI